jgi:hypothetical protein
MGKTDRLLEESLYAIGKEVVKYLFDGGLNYFWVVVDTLPQEQPVATKIPESGIHDFDLGQQSSEVRQARSRLQGQTHLRYGQDYGVSRSTGDRCERSTGNKDRVEKSLVLQGNYEVGDIHCRRIGVCNPNDGPEQVRSQLCRRRLQYTRSKAATRMATAKSVCTSGNSGFNYFKKNPPSATEQQIY